jgi:2,3-bisphosphoglycerate-dependent phosphoglycerate mutase
MDAALLKEFEEKYSKEKVDEALALLTYKTVDPLHKEESDQYPTLYVFRHGQTEDNANFVFSGWRDSPLTQKGKDQALALAEKMKDKKIGMLIASPQIRAVETMRIAMSLNPTAKDLEIHTDPRIRERCYGDLQGHSKLEIQLKDAALLKLIRRDFNYQPQNGESVKMVCERVKQFLDEIIPLMKESHINVAVSCHGNSIRGFKRYFEGLNDEETATTETPLAQDYGAYVIK